MFLNLLFGQTIDDPMIDFMTFFTKQLELQSWPMIKRIVMLKIKIAFLVNF